MFAITDSKGFHIAFKSGITLSTQFGGGSYCGNINMYIIGTEHLLKHLESKDAEIAIFEKSKKGEWLTRQAYQEIFDENIEDNVVGNVKLEEWLKVLDWCRTYKPKQAKAEVNEK